MKKTNRIYLLLAVGVVVIWHVIISKSGDKEITGLFSAAPKPGYTWVGGGGGSRYFWNSMKAEWRVGIRHPKYKAMSSFMRNSWTPLPGYAYRTSSDMSSIYWQPGQSHPQYKVVSSLGEGTWQPNLGYQFMYPGTSSLEVKWVPGQSYNNLKMTSGMQPDLWIPYAGYELSKEGNLLKATWKEGLINTNNREQISGEDEGEWLNIDEQFEDADYGVAVTFPGCDYTTLTKVIYRSYVALNPASSVLESAFQKNLLEGSRLLMDNLIGGMPIDGRLKITKNYLEYEPSEDANWFISGDNIREFRIPATEILSVSRDDYVAVGVITIKTESSTIKFLKTSNAPWISAGSTIRDKIDLMLKYNNISY